MSTTTENTVSPARAALVRAFPTNALLLWLARPSGAVWSLKDVTWIIDPPRLPAQCGHCLLHHSRNTLPVPPSPRCPVHADVTRTTDSPRLPAQCVIVHDHNSACSRLTYQMPQNQRTPSEMAPVTQVLTIDPRMPAKRIPRVKLVVGGGNARKRLPPTPEPEYTDEQNSTPTDIETTNEPKAKKAKKELRFLLTLLVVFEKRKLMDETSVEKAGDGLNRGTFNYHEFASREAKVVGLHAMRKKHTLERFLSRATVRHGIEGKFGQLGGSGSGAGQRSGVGDMVSRTVDDPEDWEKVEAIAAEWVMSGKKDVRVELQVDYRVPSGEGGDTESEIDSYAEEQSAQLESSTSGLPLTDNNKQQKPRRTATVILREEMEKQQEEDQSYIPALMRRWRCQNPMCKQYPDHSCLVLAHEKPKCRPLNAHVLGIWDSKIKKGESTEHSFPLDVKMPPLGERSGKATASTNIAPAVPEPVPMHISVNAPQQIPWWLGPNGVDRFPLPTSNTFQQSSLNNHVLSSPLRTNGMSSIRLLETFIEWFKDTKLSADSEEELMAVSQAYLELKKEMYDLDGVRTMDLMGWKELKVPVGLGYRMSKAVKEFNNSNKNLIY